MSKRKLKKAAAEAAAQAAETSSRVWDDGLQRAAALLAEAQKTVGNVIDSVQKKAGPAVQDASVKAATFASKQLDSWQPAIKGALDKVSPAVGAATYKLSDDYLPRLQDVLHGASGRPTLAEMAATPEKKKGGKFKKFVKFVAIGTAVVGAVAAVRHFLAPKDDGWTAHEPSRTYVNNTEAPAPAWTPEAPADAEGKVASAEEQAAEAVMDEVPVETIEETVIVEETTDATPASYGEGSYVGDNPPEGFNIKGNERSKKYHLEGSGGYERTIAEVWFNSEEAAQAAGFSKAQR